MNNIVCYNSMGALSIHLHQVFQPSKFQQLLTDPTAIVHCNLSVHLSLHRSCIQSHRLPLNWPSRHHLKIKHMKCVLYELFVWLSLSVDMKLMQVELAYDMQPMAWTQLHLMIFHPSCSYQWNMQQFQGLWNWHIHWTICKSFIMLLWMKRICFCQTLD
jgi:hypothetical protein